MNETTQSIETKISELQNNYYSQNSKSWFFKSSQKMECAAMVSQTCSLRDLFEKTAYYIPGSNRIYFDYVLFKTYGHPSIYDEFIDYVMTLFRQYIQEYERNTFELHINLQSFTITAAQRYKDIITVFCSKCLGNNTVFFQHLHNVHIYNPPKMIDTFSNMFAGYIDDNIRSKIVLHNEAFSVQQLHNA